MEDSTSKPSIITTSVSSAAVQSDSTIIPVVAMMEDTDNQEGHGQEPQIVEKMDSKVPKVPCIICFVPVTTGLADKSRIFEPLTQEEKEEDRIFQWFLINFRFSFIRGKKKKGRPAQKQVERFDDLFKNSSIKWDGQGGKSPPLPFCEECKYEVIGLMEKKNGLEILDKMGKEEENELREEMREIRQKMGRCEYDYLESGIYEKDKRYHRVRRYIMNVGALAPGLRKKAVEEKTKVVEEVPEERPEVVEVPCLICCETLKICSEEENFLKKNENYKLFSWFLYNLQNPPGQQLFKMKKKKGGDGEGEEEGMRGWDGQWGKSEPLRFCGGCRDGGLMEFFEGFRTKEMYERRGRWVRETRKRMKELEDRFVESGIYERDPRYFNVRRKVINVLETPRLLLKEVPQEKKKRKLEREKERLEAMMAKKKKEEPPKITLKFVEEGTGDPEIDKIMEQRFRRILPRPSAQHQVVKVIVKQEEKMDEEENKDTEDDEEDEYPWEDEEEEPPIIQVKKEKNLGEEEMDQLGPDTGASRMEEENCENRHRNCLLCYKAISKEESALAPVLTNDLNEQNFNSVFILRKMLNVPKERLVGYLENFGCPGKWVEYCKDCFYLVDAALRIQKEISELEDKLRKCQEKMVLKIKSTCQKNRKNKLANELNRVTEEAREFVSSKCTSGKNTIKKVSQAANFVLPPQPEVASDPDNYNEPLEYPSAPPSPPDNFDLDPSYSDNCGPPSPEQVISKPNPSSPAKKPKLSARDRRRLKNRMREVANGEQLLKSLTSGGSTYTCILCPHLNKPMSFIKFYRHLIFHNQRPFKCSVCNVYWSSASELEKNPFVREVPSSTHFCSEATLVKIAGEDGKIKPGKIWECAWCSEKFEKKKERNLHEKEAHPHSKSVLKLKHNCSLCSKAYRSFKEWLLHRVLEHPEIAAITCLFCDKTCVTKTNEGIDILNLAEMKKHLSSQHPSCINIFVSPETCDFCGLPFKFGKDNLSKHLKDEHKLTSGLCTYKCPCCYFRTNRLFNLRDHLNMQHSVGGPRMPFPSQLPEYKKKYNKPREQVICDVCGKMVRGSLILLEHKLGQHGIEPKDMSEYNGQEVFRCEKGNECGGYSTLMKPKMREHMIKMHGMETKFRCGECGKEFANSSHLGRHQDIHRNKGVKPHQCEICGNSFAVKNYLYIHMRLSHQNRPFASTNRKRTTMRVKGKVGRGITAVMVGQGSNQSVVEMGLEGQTKQGCDTAEVSNGESVDMDSVLSGII